MSDPATGVLAVDDLRFRYGRGSEELFDGLSYEFRAGRVTTVTGSSGRGKSTMLYLLGLLLTPTSGTVLVDGTAASRLSDSTRSLLRARRFGFVFQDAELDPTRTIVDAVVEPGLYGGGSRVALADRARELLELLGLGHRADHRPGEISGGQAQRVAICRALLNEPDVLVADEPTGNLDQDNSERVMEILAAQAHDHGRTVVVASHDPFIIDHSDLVLRL